MEADFCIEAVAEALARYGKPDIFNTDQGSQSTSIDFTAVLKKAEIDIDGRQGRMARQRLRRAALAVDQI
jgi:putative transposase